LRIAFAGEVGDDYFGRFLIEALEAANVDTRLIAVNPAVKTGVTVHLAQDDDRAMLTYMGTLNTFDAASLDADLLAGTRHVHTGSYFMLPRLRPALPGIFEEARRLGATTSLDTNFDPSDAWDGGVRDLLPHVNVFLPNQLEALRISGMADLDHAVEALAARCGAVAVKLGSAGAAAWSGEAHETCRPPEVRVVDTRGAGDSFDAGFLYGYLNDWPLVDALRLGCACGALCASGPGISTQPTLEQALDIAQL
jgi:sugar/nucleoside kinase (ribokinase family)